MRTFDTVAEMLQVFEKAQVPVRTNVVKLGESKMLFVSAYPYSGANTIDLLLLRPAFRMGYFCGFSLTSILPLSANSSLQQTGKSPWCLMGSS